LPVLGKATARRAAVAFAMAAAGSWANPARAFCRTTTCDAAGDQTDCKVQAGCSTEGLPLYWPERCLSFGVQQDGSKKRGITWQTTDQIVRLAFQQWLGAKCADGRTPSFDMFDLNEAGGPIICDQPEFNKSAPNANVWMYRDDEWPYLGVNSTLALTTITFEVPTGKILDADVELNSFRIDNLSTSGAPDTSDLQSIVTHEAGHFLGLAHSAVAAATMNANYTPGRISFRSLDPDDQAGICAVYPPNRDAPACTQPTPRHGFSRHCGGEDPESDGTTKKSCSMSLGRAPSGDGTALAALGLAGALFVRRRARMQRESPVRSGR
jgi:hypothetical protein